MSSYFHAMHFCIRDACSMATRGIENMKAAKTWCANSKLVWVIIGATSTCAGCATVHTLYYSPKVVNLATHMVNLAIPVMRQAWDCTQRAFFKNGAPTALSGALIMLITLVAAHRLYRMCTNPARDYEAELRVKLQQHDRLVELLVEKSHAYDEAMQALYISDAELASMKKYCDQALVYKLYIQLREKHTRLHRKYKESRASEMTVEVLARYLKTSGLKKALASDRRTLPDSDVLISKIVLEYLISKRLLSQEIADSDSDLDEVM